MTAAPQPDDLLALALGVARETGDLLLRMRKQELSTATKTTLTDVVTAGDIAAERLIRERLLAARPGDGLLGEEGSSVDGTSGVRWVVDPVDGTVNYLYRLPNWAVSIGAEVDGDVVAGVVHSPMAGVTYTATRGGGAFRDGRRLSGSVEAELALSLVATGFAYASDRRAWQARVLLSVLPKVRDIRRLGAASLDLCGAAEGLVDAYYEWGLSPWDLAAGGLVAREAGLLVTGFDGSPPSEDMVIAAPPALHGPLVELLGAAGAGG